MICLQPPTQGLSLLHLRQGKGREKNCWYEVNLVRLCATLFPNALSRRKPGRRFWKVGFKNVLRLTLAYMLSSARFHDMCCFTCT